MDQLRKAGDWLRRHHFWVLTVIAILVALGGWWTGGNTLWKSYTDNKSKIESEFNNANTVSSKPFHANSAVQEAQTAEITKQQESVNALWAELYDRQTAAVLKWPANLSEEFRDNISKLSFGADIAPNLRRHYNNYIRDHFPELPKIVGALETADTGQSGGGYGARGGGGGSVDVQSILQNLHNSTGRGGAEDPGQAFDEPEFLVIWADQQLIRDELAPRSTPSSKRIWKTQEDLWVYEALLTIIANTNKAAGADQFSNSAIRVIESLEVGRTAAQASRGKGRIEMPVAAPTGDPMMEGGGEMMDGGRGGMMPESVDGGMMAEGMYGGGRGEMGMGTDSATMDAELLNSRYVGEDGAPIADPGGSDLSAFGVEFKRLPVRMRLWMDQRWLPQLISECANAPLQVEVQEVRVNPADDGASGYGGGGGGRGGDGGYGAATTAMTMDMTPEQEPNMKTVVLQGTVYIFNPPTTDAQPASDPALSTASAE